MRSVLPSRVRKQICLNLWKTISNRPTVCFGSTLVLDSDRVQSDEYFIRFVRCYSACQTLVEQIGQKSSFSQASSDWSSTGSRSDFLQVNIHMIKKILITNVDVLFICQCIDMQDRMQGSLTSEIIDEGCAYWELFPNVVSENLGVLFDHLVWNGQQTST